jgi:dTDP-4-dehydrorhamnose reductase
MNNFLLLGDKGYLGSYLKNKINCDVLLGRSIYDNGKKYKYIINCIAKTNVAYCEKKIEESFYSNAYIINDIKKLYPESKIINFSSYYVYNDENLCDESSDTSDSLIYSKQKLLSESLNSSGLNFRLGKLFGNIYSEQNRLTEKVLKENILTIDNILFNPASVQCIEKVLSNESFLAENTGVFNLANSGYVSHYDYAVFINEYLDLKKEIHQINDVEKQFANHGKFLMSTEKIEFFIQLNHWKIDLIEYLNHWSSIYL